MLNPGRFPSRSRLFTIRSLLHVTVSVRYLSRQFCSSYSPSYILEAVYLAGDLFFVYLLMTSKFGLPQFLLRGSTSHLRIFQLIDFCFPIVTFHFNVVRFKHRQYTENISPNRIVLSMMISLIEACYLTKSSKC